MTWRLVAACAAGTSHQVAGGHCEDSCWAQGYRLASGEELVAIFASDGAGSAAHGRMGADLAMEATAAFLDAQCKKGEFGLSDSLAADLVVSVREAIFAQAAQQSLRARDFACTLLGVVSSSRGTLVLQIGDGAVVLDVGSGLELAIVPMSGEYANMTNFVTDDDAISVLQTRVYSSGASRIAVLTDGLQRLALDLATNMPHEPFFLPFFKTLARASPDQADELHAALLRFLESPAVNERTDDDKTLALAVRTD